MANPQAYEPVNFPPLPEEDDEEPPADAGDASTSEVAREPPPPPVVDGGEWDGTGFKSSGLLYEGSYSLTFTKPGTYIYACLVHPLMVGKVIVR